MATILIACSMLEDEIYWIMEQEQLHYPIHWMPRGLHASPEVLRAELQQCICRYEADYDTILLGYCLCGGSLGGLKSSKATLSAMHCDDCIHMLMHQKGVDKRGLYFTAGWIRSDQFIGKEYEQTAERRGPEKAKRVYARILKGYQTLYLVGTGAYPLSAFAQEARDTAQKLRLRYEMEEGDTKILRALLTGRPDARVWTVPPGEAFALPGYGNHIYR